MFPVSASPSGLDFQPRPSSQREMTGWQRNRRYFTHSCDYCQLVKAHRILDFIG